MDVDQDEEDDFRVNWHYDLDDYVQVRLAPDEAQERRLINEMMQLKSAEADSVRPNTHNDLVYFAIRQTMFWTILAEKVMASGYGMIDLYEMATEMFDSDQVITKKGLLKGFGLISRDIEREAAFGGLLFSSPSHERATQLSNIDLAVHSLISADVWHIYEGLERPRTSFWSANDRRSWSDQRSKCKDLLDLLRKGTLRLAFATLWTWKCHLREQRQWNSTEDERIALWRFLLKIYGMCAPYDPESDDCISPKNLQGVFAGDISGTKNMVVDVPILRQTLRELWATWSAVIWRSPGLQIGKDFHVCVRLMVFRAAFFVSFSGNVNLFDYQKYVRIPNVNLSRYVNDASDLELTVNDTFMIDTERVFSYLLEACFTSKHLDPGRLAPRATERQRQEWESIVSDCLKNQTASFVQKQLEKHGWHRYTYWDEIERFRRQSHSIITMPRKVLGDFRQGDCDAVFDVLRSKNSLELLWRSAGEEIDKDMEIRRSTMDGNDDADLSRGWSWRIAWDIRRAQERERGKDNDLPEDIEEIFDEASGESFYIYRQNQRRVRGTDLQRIQMSKSVKLSAAGLVAKNIIEEIALKVLLKTRIDVSSTSAHLSIFSAYKQSNNLTLINLLSHGMQPPHKIQHYLLSEFPTLLSQHNRYYVFDSEMNYANTESLLDALYAWALSCERVVREKLSDLLGQLDEDSAAEANEQLLREAESIVERIPKVLRRMFDMVRGDIVMQPDPERYRIPQSVRFVPCAWDQANIVDFFVRNHPGLNISRTLASMNTNGRRPVSSSNSLDSEQGSEESDLDNILGISQSLGRQTRALRRDDDDDDDEEEELIRDVVEVLGGIDW